MLYAQGQDWLQRQDIMGRAVGYLPHVGRVTIIMNDYPYVKARKRKAGRRGAKGPARADVALLSLRAQYLLIGVLGLLVVTSKD